MNVIKSPNGKWFFFSTPAATTPLLPPMLTADLPQRISTHLEFGARHCQQLTFLTGGEFIRPSQVGGSLSPREVISILKDFCLDFAVSLGTEKSFGKKKIQIQTVNKVDMCDMADIWRLMERENQYQLLRGILHSFLDSPAHSSQWKTFWWMKRKGWRKDDKRQNRSGLPQTCSILVETLPTIPASHILQDVTCTARRNINSASSHVPR